MMDSGHWMMVLSLVAAMSFGAGNCSGGCEAVVECDEMSHVRGCNGNFNYDVRECRPDPAAIEGGG